MNMSPDVLNDPNEDDPSRTIYRGTVKGLLAGLALAAVVDTVGNATGLFKSNIYEVLYETTLGLTVIAGGGIVGAVIADPEIFS